MTCSDVRKSSEAESRREVSRQSGVMQYFLVLVWFCNLFFSLLGHSRRKALMCQQAPKVKLKILRTELQRLNVHSHSYSFPWRELGWSQHSVLRKANSSLTGLLSFLHPNSEPEMMSNLIRKLSGFSQVVLGTGEGKFRRPHRPVFFIYVLGAHRDKASVKVRSCSGLPEVKNQLLGLEKWGHSPLVVPGIT